MALWALLVVALMALAGCVTEAPQEAREGEEEGGARETMDAGNVTDGNATDRNATAGGQVAPTNATPQENATANETGNRTEARTGTDDDRRRVSGRVGPITYTRLVLSHAREEVQAFRVLATEDVREEDVRDVRTTFERNREELEDVRPPSDFRRSHRYLLDAHDDTISALDRYEDCLARGDDDSRECNRAERRVERAADRLDNGMDRLFRDLRRAANDFR